jgi:hypothetical protein
MQTEAMGDFEGDDGTVFICGSSMAIDRGFCASFSVGSGLRFCFAIPAGVRVVHSFHGGLLLLLLLLLLRLLSFFLSSFFFFFLLLLLLSSSSVRRKEGAATRGGRPLAGGPPTWRAPIGVGRVHVALIETAELLFFFSFFRKCMFALKQHDNIEKPR